MTVELKTILGCFACLLIVSAFNLSKTENVEIEFKKSNTTIERIPMEVVKHTQVKKITLKNIFDVISQLESAGDPNAINGEAVGIIQITPIYLEEVNRLSGLNFQPNDRYNVDKCFQMFQIFNKNKTNIEEIVRTHRSGFTNQFDEKSAEYWERANNLLYK